MVIPDEIMPIKNTEEVCSKKDIVLFAVPSAFVRNTAKKGCSYIYDDQNNVNVAKVWNQIPCTQRLRL